MHVRTLTLFLKKIIYAALFVSLFSATENCKAAPLNSAALTKWLEKCFAPGPAWDESEGQKDARERKTEKFTKLIQGTGIEALEKAIEAHFYKDEQGLVKHRSFQQGLPMTGDAIFMIDAIDEQKRDKKLKDYVHQDELTAGRIQSAVEIRKATTSMGTESYDDAFNADRHVAFMADRDPSKDTKTFTEKKNQLANMRIDYAQLMRDDLPDLMKLFPPNFDTGTKRELIKLLYRRICEDPQTLKYEFSHAGEVPKGFFETSDTPKKLTPKIGPRNKHVYGKPAYRYDQYSKLRDGTRVEHKTKTAGGKKLVASRLPRTSDEIPPQTSFASAVPTFVVNVSDLESPQSSPRTPVRRHSSAASTNRNADVSPWVTGRDDDEDLPSEVGLPPEAASLDDLESLRRVAPTRRTEVSPGLRPLGTRKYLVGGSMMSGYSTPRKRSAPGATPSHSKSGSADPVASSTSVSSNSSGRSATPPRKPSRSVAWAASLRSESTPLAKRSPAKPGVYRPRTPLQHPTQTTFAQRNMQDALKKANRWTPPAPFDRSLRGSR